jgi:glycosyltransferase involved in cell wall biosynthesis
MKLGICAIIRDESRYILEWLAFHIIQGVSEFILFDDGSSDQTPELVREAGRHADITLIPLGTDCETFDHVQRKAYVRGSAYMYGKVDFLAFIDADEFLYSKGGLSLPAELKRFSGDVSAIAINLRLFGSSGHSEYSPDLVISRFTRCTKPGHPGNLWVKTIARPERELKFDSVHTVDIGSGCYVHNDLVRFEKSPEHPGRGGHIGAGNLQINHYMLKSFSEFKEKQARGRIRGLGTRYDDSFFLRRDTPDWANGFVDNYLLRYEDATRYMMLNLAGPRTQTQEKFA